MDRRSHWENVYHTKSATNVSWFEAEPTTSLSLIQSVATGGQIIDVGGGASLLVDCLVAVGTWEVTVLDVSATALELAQTRLHEQAHRVKWIQADITEVQQLGTYDVWHDRAVFHFLTSLDDRAAYLAQLRRALRPGGYVVLGTFALDGPDKCSGLPVCRYDARSLAATLGADYSLVKKLEYSHPTPGGTTQRFTFAVFRKAV
jgi:2-polyprenyl-3-methyl-5-hydroxy-6-metoxy-1,4-benzoquinol methylase